ncbi:MAG: hypothetical protein ACRDHG_04865, partial [Anaerolineales bacterium]
MAELAVALTGILAAAGTATAAAAPSAGTLAAIGTGIAATGAVYGGIQQYQAGKATAKQLEQKAADERAIAQRDAAQRRKEGDFLASRARAVAGASGAGVSD